VSQGVTSPKLPKCFLAGPALEVPQKIQGLGETRPGSDQRAGGAFQGRGAGAVHLALPAVDQLPRVDRHPRAWSGST
jgi:hypothetical protein